MDFNVDTRVDKLCLASKPMPEEQLEVTTGTANIVKVDDELEACKHRLIQLEVLLRERDQGIEFLKGELKQSHRRIEARCQQINQELLGVKRNDESNFESLAEDVTVRQILEKIEFELKFLSVKAREFEDQRKQSGPLISTGTQTVINEESCPILDIVATTTKEADQLILDEIHKIRAEKNVEPGVSVQGRDISSLAPSLEPHGVTFTINNFLEIPLTDMQMSGLFGEFLDSFPPSTVKGGTAELMVLNGHRQRNILSYQLESTQIRLIMIFECSCPDQLVAIGFAPAQTKITLETYRQLKACTRYRPELKNNASGEKNICIKFERFRASLNLSNEAILSIDIGSLEAIPKLQIFPNASRKDYFELVNSKFPLQDDKGVLAKLADEYVVLVRIYNALNVRMIVRLTPHRLPVLPNGSTKIWFNNDRLLKKYFVYHLNGTDLKIAFECEQKEDGDNLFSMEFAHGSYRTLPRNLGSHEEWTSRSYRAFGKASEGIIQITTRNIIIQAEMTQGKKAILQINVSLF